MKNLIITTLALVLMFTCTLNFTLSQELLAIQKDSGPELIVEVPFQSHVSNFLADLENHKKMNPSNPILNQRINFISIKMVHINPTANAYSQTMDTCVHSSSGIVLSAKVPFEIWKRMNDSGRQFMVSKIISSCMKRESFIQKDMI